MSAAPQSTPGLLWQAAAAPDKIDLVEAFAQQPGTVLDIGAGAGWYGRLLAQRGARVAALDVAAWPAEPGLGRVTGNITALPFGDRVFDTVLLFDILEHVPEESAALAEVARVTRKRVLLSVPSSDDGFLFDYGLSLLHHVDKTHVREYTPALIRSRLRACGFQVVEMRFSRAPRMPMVVLEFFRAGYTGRLARRVTSVWLRSLMKLGLVRNELAGDILCVADRVE